MKRRDDVKCTTREITQPVRFTSQPRRSSSDSNIHINGFLSYSLFPFCFSLLFSRESHFGYLLQLWSRFSPSPSSWSSCVIPFTLFSSRCVSSFSESFTTFAFLFFFFWRKESFLLHIFICLVGDTCVSFYFIHWQQPVRSYRSFLWNSRRESWDAGGLLLSGASWKAKDEEKKKKKEGLRWWTSLWMREKGWRKAALLECSSKIWYGWRGLIDS